MSLPKSVTMGGHTFKVVVAKEAEMPEDWGDFDMDTRTNPRESLGHQWQRTNTT